MNSEALLPGAQVKRYIRDNDILERIGCGADQFAYIEDGRENGLDEDGLLQASSLSDDEDCNIEYDNSRCDADFEKVEDGYAGQDGFMKGVMFKMERRPSEAYARCVGTYTSDGMYMMGSSRGVTAYLGWNGRAKCLALPQCKMMNSTVLDGYARRTVHVGRSRLS